VNTFKKYPPIPLLKPSRALLKSTHQFSQQSTQQVSLVRPVLNDSDSVRLLMIRITNTDSYRFVVYWFHQGIIFFVVYHKKKFTLVQMQKNTKWSEKKKKKKMCRQTCWQARSNPTCTLVPAYLSTLYISPSYSQHLQIHPTPPPPSFTPCFLFGDPQTLPRAKSTTLKPLISF